MKTGEACYDNKAINIQTLYNKITICKHQYNAVSLPVPGLTRNASQDEPQAETNEGVDCSNDP